MRRSRGLWRTHHLQAPGPAQAVKLSRMHPLQALPAQPVKLWPTHHRQAPGPAIELPAQPVKLSRTPPPQAPGPAIELL